jgi:SAM-dependent methyltransferase
VPILFRGDLPRAIDLRDGMRVLEVGTGDGETAVEVAGWFRGEGKRAEVIAVDLHDSRREQVARRCATAGDPDLVRFVRADATRLPPIGPFDMVFCVKCLSQILFELAPRVSPEPARLACTRLLSHWGSLMAPGGTLVVLDLDRGAPGDAYARGAAMLEARTWPHLPVPVLRTALLEAAFDGVEVRTTPLARYGKRVDVPRWLGGGLPPEEKKPRPIPASPWPLPVVSAEGDVAFSLFVLQARRPG